MAGIVGHLPEEIRRHRRDHRNDDECRCEYVRGQFGRMMQRQRRFHRERADGDAGQRRQLLVDAEVLAPIEQDNLRAAFPRLAFCAIRTAGLRQLRPFWARRMSVALRRQKSAALAGADRGAARARALHQVVSGHFTSIQAPGSDEVTSLMWR
jgi:hypothetical protein